MAMKTLFKIFMIAAINIFVAVSCIKESDSSVNDIVLVPITLSAESVEVKTTLSGGEKVLWEGNDKVSLLSGDGYRTLTEMRITDMDQAGTWAKFEGECEKGSESFIAVYPHSQNYTYENESVAVTIPSEQKAVLAGFQSGANVAVAYSEDDELMFNNVGSVIGITIWESDAAKTKKITLKARKSETEYWGLTGLSTVKFAQGDLQVTEGATEYITLLPPEGNDVFSQGGTYYFVVYPGEYKGFEITFTDIYGREIMRSNDRSQTLGRNEKIILHRIPDPYAIIPAGELTVTVDFTKKWPFEEQIVDVDSQLAAGDRYTYHHPVTFKNETTFEPLSFVISRNGAGYGYVYYNAASPYYLNLQANASSTISKFIKIPGISGKYLKSVTVNYRNGTNKSFKIGGIQSSMGCGYNNEDPSNSYIPAEFTFSSATVQSEEGKSYTMTDISGNTTIKSLVLVYTDEEPQ